MSRQRRERGRGREGQGTRVPAVLYPLRQQCTAQQSEQTALARWRVPQVRSSEVSSCTPLLCACVVSCIAWVCSVQAAAQASGALGQDSGREQLCGSTASRAVQPAHNNCPSCVVGGVVRGECVPVLAVLLWVPASERARNSDLLLQTRPRADATNSTRTTTTYALICTNTTTITAQNR